MKLRRLFVDCEFKDGEMLSLDARQQHYLGRVLRLKHTQAIEVFNQTHRAAAIFTANKRHASLEIVSVLTTDTRMANASNAALSITLAQCIARGDRMDYAVQKATELGVQQIRPLIADTTAVKMTADSRIKRLNHWQQIAIHAAEQSGRYSVPSVQPIIDFSDFIMETTQSCRLLLSPDASMSLNTFCQGCPQPPTHVSLLVGCEGGLTETEEALAIKNGYQAIRVGPRILRTETVAPAVLAVIQNQWGDWQ